MELAGSFRASSGADAGLPDGAGGSPPPAQAVRATASRQASPVMDCLLYTSRDGGLEGGDDVGGLGHRLGDLVDILQKGLHSAQGDSPAQGHAAAQDLSLIHI